MNFSDLKLLEADRKSMTFELLDWENMIDEDHLAKRIMVLINEFDLSELYKTIQTRKFAQGRSAIDPKILLAIWLYATVKGLTSSREIADQCAWEPGFRWILGCGLTVQYVTLAEFRKNAGKALDSVMTQIVTLLLASGMASSEEVALDGTKIKASAGKGSFRTKEELEELGAEVENKIANLKNIPKDSAHKAHLENKKARIDRALELIPGIQKELKEDNKKRKKGTPVPKAKASSTDPDSRNMRFADDSFSPAYNAQVITSSKGGIILTVDPTQRRNDTNLINPMIKDLKKRIDDDITQVLVDTGYESKSDVEEVIESGIKVYGSQKKPRKGTTEQSKKRLINKHKKDSQVIQDWRELMATDAAREVRKRRGRTEKVHGWIKHILSWQLNLRSIDGVKTELLLLSSGYNLIRFFNMSDQVLAKPC
jgi:transposase